MNRSAVILMSALKCFRNSKLISAEGITLLLRAIFFFFGSAFSSPDLDFLRFFFLGCAGTGAETGGDSDSALIIVVSDA